MILCTHMATCRGARGKSRVKPVWKWALASAWSAAILCGGVASAQPANGPTAIKIQRGDARDLAAVQAASVAANQSGPMAIAEHVTALQAVLDRAPKSFPEFERHGDLLIVRSSRSDDQPALVAQAGEPAPRILRAEYNTYGYASFLLGSFWNEIHEPAKAVAALDRGLVLQPRNGLLIGERGAALAALRRFDDAMASYDPWLAAGIGSPLQRALILRARGFALIELNRLDEAEHDYLESLKLEPCHAGARHELAYIAGRRTGTEHSSPSKLLTYDKAKGTCSPV